MPNTIKPEDIQAYFYSRKELKFRDGRVITAVVRAPVFWQFVEPLGKLNADKECHALWFYYVSAMTTYELQIVDPIQLEGEVDTGVNFRQLFLNSADVYAVRPEAMSMCWHLVDANCDLFGIPKLPNEERYRFDAPLKLS